MVLTKAALTLLPWKHQVTQTSKCHTKFSLIKFKKNSRSLTVGYFIMNVQGQRGHLRTPPNGPLPSGKVWLTGNETLVALQA